MCRESSLLERLQRDGAEVRRLRGEARSQRPQKRALALLRAEGAVRLRGGSEPPVALGDELAEREVERRLPGEVLGHRHRRRRGDEIFPSFDSSSSSARDARASSGQSLLQQGEVPPEPPELLPAVPQPSHVAQRRRVRLEIPRVRRGDLHRAPPRERVADGFVFPGGGANIVVVVTRRARRTSSAEDVARVRGGVHLERLRGVLSAVFARVERRGGERGAGPVVPPGVARARGRRTRRGRGSGRANRGLEPKRRVHVRGEPRGERRGGRGVVARGGGRGVVGVVVVIRGHGGGGGGRFRARGAGEVVLPGVGGGAIEIAFEMARVRRPRAGRRARRRVGTLGGGGLFLAGGSSRGGGARFGRARRGARAGRRLRTGFGGSRRAEGGAGGGRRVRGGRARIRVVAGGARPGGATSIRGRRARALRADAHAGEGAPGASPPRAEGAAPSAGAIATPGARRGMREPGRRHARATRYGLGRAR